jgi:enediyne biosynthesis protein CalE5
MTSDKAEVITKWLVSGLSLQAGDRVLEIAGGPGTVAFAVAATGLPAHVSCTDVNVAAVSSAASDHRATGGPSLELGSPPPMSFLAADMQALPFRGDTFDAVVCRWGVMFVLDPRVAFLEARRVLRPGGRFSFAVWGPPEDNRWQSILDEELEASGIEDRSKRYRPGGMFSLKDQEALRAMLAETGFVIERLERVSLIRHYRDFGEYWSEEVDVDIERSANLRALLTAEAEAFRGRLQGGLSPYLGPAGYQIPGICLTATASRPQT